MTVVIVADERFNPGAMFLANIAASIQKVPDPQVGSISGLSGYQLYLTPSLI